MLGSAEPRTAIILSDFLRYSTKTIFPVLCYKSPTGNNHQKEDTMPDTLSLIDMAHIAMDAGTIEGSPASMTAEEIIRAYTLAILMLAAFQSLGGAE